MKDDFKDVEDMVEAMRERGRTAEPLQLASFEETMATVERLRRRRWMLRGFATLAAAGVAAVVGVMLLREDTSQPAGEQAAAFDPAQREAPQRREPLALRRMQPFPDLVAFADGETQVSFPSPARVVLASGTLTLQFRCVGDASRLAVETPTAVVAITGTVLSVGVRGDGTAVEVLRGRVEVTRSGKTITVGEGQLLRPGAGAPEPLPRGRSERLASLFPEEQPGTPPVATPEPTAPPIVASTEIHPPESPTTPVSRVAAPGDDSDAEPQEGSPTALDLDEIYRLAEEAMRARRHAEARVLLEELLGRVPAGSSLEETALVDLAQTCGRLGDKACARESLQRYLDHHPRGALREQARLDLCGLLEDTGTPSEWTSCLREYLSEFPEGRKARWAREALDGQPPGSPEGDGV